MLAAVQSVIPESAMDFPDGAMRFNWCNCQPSVRGMGAVALGAPYIAPPLVDFNFWNARLTGGGAPTEIPAPAGVAPSLLSNADGSVSTTGLLLAAAAVGLFMWDTFKRRG